LRTQAEGNGATEVGLRLPSGHLNGSASMQGKGYHHIEYSELAGIVADIARCYGSTAMAAFEWQRLLQGTGYQHPMQQ
jgi:hypothetical protein